MSIEIDVNEWSALIRRIGTLEGAIAAHEILTRQDRRPEDDILYRIVKEGTDA